MVLGKASLRKDLSKDLKKEAKHMGERVYQAQQSCVPKQVRAVCPRRLESLGWSEPEHKVREMQSEVPGPGREGPYRLCEDQSSL